MEREKSIAIIPARSGSKGLKDKNIKLLHEKPLLAYSVEAAIESGMFDVVMVSTDSEDYAAIAREYGAMVPFLRSEELASDSAATWDVVLDILAWYRRRGEEFDHVFLLQPTSPLRTSKDIQDAFALYAQKEANAVVGVCETEHSPLWTNTLPQDLSMTSFIREEVKNRPRQELERYYRINGAVYLVRARYLEQCNSIYDSGCFAFVMDKKRSVDIDDEYDFVMAEAIGRYFGILD